MGLMAYQGFVAIREWGERQKLDPVVSFGKMATMIVSLIVRVGGGTVNR
jgi:hypothetical protein